MKTFHVNFNTDTTNGVNVETLRSVVGTKVVRFRAANSNLFGLSENTTYDCTVVKAMLKKRSIYVEGVRTKDTELVAGYLVQIGEKSYFISAFEHQLDFSAGMKIQIVTSSNAKLGEGTAARDFLTAEIVG